MSIPAFRKSYGVEQTKWKLPDDVTMENEKYISWTKVKYMPDVFLVGIQTILQSTG